MDKSKEFEIEDKIRTKYTNMYIMSHNECYKMGYDDGFQDGKNNELEIFRRNTTKDLLCAILNNVDLNNTNKEDVVGLAITYADEFIKQLNN